MAGNYSGEQGDPTVGACPVSAQTTPSPTLKLRFDGSALTLSGGKKAHTYPAWSGMKGVDPIPAGRYWINPAELVANSLRHPKMWLASSAWGTHRITLHPYAETVKSVGNRGGFFIHGGSEPGSKGCIDLVGQMSAFVDDLLAEFDGKQPDCHVELSVEYPPVK